jgi:DNA repair exonuclease SbcCD ATPase subunit
VSERWRSEIQARVTRARELGLIVDGTAAVTTERGIELLRGVVASANVEGNVTGASVSQAVGELGGLQQEESEVSHELSGLRHRFAEMSQLKNTAVAFRGALEVQRDRLKVSEWVQGLHDSQHVCPICRNPLQEEEKEVQSLLTSLREVEETATQFDRVPAAFDREFERVRAAISLAAERLRGIQLRRRALEQTSQQARALQYTLAATAHFVGGLEADLRTYESVRSDGDLEREVTTLRGRVRQLESDISEEEIRRRVERALRVVNLNAGRLIPDLDAERP